MLDSSHVRFATEIEWGNSSLAWPDHFFPFFFVVAEKGSGDLTIGFACDEIPRFWGVLIAGDELKRGVKDLWDYVSQLDIHINTRDQYNIAACKLRANHYKNMLYTIPKGPTSDVVKTKGSIAY